MGTSTQAQVVCTHDPAMWTCDRPPQEGRTPAPPQLNTTPAYATVAYFPPPTHRPTHATMAAPSRYNCRDLCPHDRHNPHLTHCIDYPHSRTPCGYGRPTRVVIATLTNVVDSCPISRPSINICFYFLKVFNCFATRRVVATNIHFYFF